MSSDQYGHFSEDWREYIVTDPRPVRPWANVISNPRIGLAVSQSGSGFTWIDNSQLATVNWWKQDFAEDSSGKFLYARERESDEVWSLSPAPVWGNSDHYECRHGIGYTTFVMHHHGINAEWTLFAHESEPVEMWIVSLRNKLSRRRSIELTGFLEWCCGVSPAPRREFHKLFIETAFDRDARAIFGWNHMWDVGSKRWGHWNTDFPYVSGLGTTELITSAEGEKSAFIGRNGSLREPAGLHEREWKGLFGRHHDPIAAMRMVVDLAAGEEKKIGFAIAVDKSREASSALLKKWLDVGAMQKALVEVKQSWVDRLASHRMETPDARFNSFINDWARYQAISARIWGRAGYYQQSGAFGFRDQLQDSQVWLTIDDRKCRDQINLHAAHQFADGSVYHWWHPLSEQGLVTKMTDDLLWLSFVTSNYIKETGDHSVLDDKQPFLDDETPATVEEHIRRAFERVFQRTSMRGLPFIGAGDWNDGLSAAGLEEKGESIWLAHFLAGLLGEWSEIHRRSGRAPFAADYAQRRETLVKAINDIAWDGNWYFRATLDDGGVIGSSKNKQGRIYLNAQTWAVLNEVAPPERAAACMASVREHLVSESGALLLAPAYDTPDEKIGYITRYAPGLRENGGVYTHAATWAIAAAAKMKDAELVGQLLTAIDPTNKDPERYWAEPYVLPGNVDGPDSPWYGRAGWTWYTGSASWLHRIVGEWVLGVRPTWDGLLIDPCLPPSWDRARMIRPWRGAVYDITIERGASPRLLPPPKAGEKHVIVVKP
ncbi:MAG: glycosyl transferase family 36 [Thermoanaerobaculia bacterium]|nr:glycosyl transferase family 36 [Thermoanaerobaculia bacterium]